MHLYVVKYVFGKLFLTFVTSFKFLFCFIIKWVKVSLDFCPHRYMHVFSCFDLSLIYFHRVLVYLANFVACH